MIQTVKTWSFSSLQKYEMCPLSVYHQNFSPKVKKKTSIEAQRGVDIHALAEHWVQGDDDDIPECLNKLPNNFRQLQFDYRDGNVRCEEKWGLTQMWEPCTWADPDVWLRLICDVVIRENKQSIRIIDYKTGRRFGKEFEHNNQLMLYAIAGMHMFPDCEHITTEIWYLKEGSTLEKHYTRDMCDIFKPKWHQRAVTMTTDTEFMSNGSKGKCKWCDFNKFCKDSYV